MRLLLTAIVVSFSSLAYADDWSFTINDQDLAIVGKALGTMPYNDVKAVIDKLNTQIGEQQKKKAAEQKDKPNEGQH